LPARQGSGGWRPRGLRDGGNGLPDPRELRGALGKRIAEQCRLLLAQ
jgi:hypothetical protein